MDSRKRTALHEAAHVVAGLVFQKLPKPRYVSIVPAADGSLGRVHGGISLDRATLGPKLLEQALTVRLAGCAAEDRALGAERAATSIKATGSRGDLEDVGRLLGAHGCKGKEADEMMERATVRAGFIVEDLAPVIERVAELLEAEGELDALGIEKVRLMCAVYSKAEADATDRLMRSVRAAAAEYRAAPVIDRARQATAAARRRA